MRRIHRHQSLHLLALVLVACWLVLSTGCDVLSRLGEALYPTETPEATTPARRTPVPTVPLEKPTEVSTFAPTLTWPAPPPTQTPEPTPFVSPTMAPQPEKEEYLVFAKGSGIYRTAYLGGEPLELASVPRLEAWDFNRGAFAMARERNVDVIDLKKGSLSSFQVQLDGQVDYSFVLWGVSGKSLLYAAVVDDSLATEFQRSVELRAVAPDTGAELGRVTLRDVTGVRILRYDDDLAQVLLISQGDDPAFLQVDYYDLQTGKLAETLPAKGEREAIISPDGRYLLVGQSPVDKGSEKLVLYYLTAEGQERPKSWEDDKPSHSVSHIWSPDGRYVAYLLREGALCNESAKGLGVWVLDVTTMQATQVIEEDSISSSLVSWTPDSVYIVGRHRGEAGDSYYYAVRPDGGDRRILALDPNAEILGWMPYTGADIVQKVTVDPWPARFLDVAGDPAAMADLVAEFVTAQVQTGDEELSRQVTDYLRQADWQLDAAGATVKRISEGLFLAQLPPISIYVLDGGHAQAVASGQLIIDGRLESDRLGLIFGLAAGGDTLQPAFVLLRRQVDGTWKPVWTPQGRRDWIATDGEIQFVGEGLGSIRVSGTSFGLDFGDNQVFTECHECTHRRLVSTWNLEGAAYVRQSELPADAPIASVYWEMTESTPYAVLYECIRRLRNGLPADELAARPEALKQLGEFGLLDKGLRLVSEEEMENGVRFGDMEGTKHFLALTKDGQLVHIQPISK